MERVNTGGLTEIRYSKYHKTPSLSQKEKEEIREAYKQADIRKKKEKIIKVTIIIAILIIALTYYLLK